MRLFNLIVLYTGLGLGANAAAAGPLDLTPYLTGQMAKLVQVAPVPVPDAALVDEGDAPRDLAGYKGKVILLNFWATWCVPCRKELGALDRLQGALEGDDFAVVAIATGPNPVPAIRKLFADEGVTRLPILRDPDQRFARSIGVLALPVSVLIDRDGNEIARMIGGAEWDGPEAKALIAALVAHVD